MRIESFDGLRGFALILVILYHTFMPYTYGGFVGVDIFFVLSGFLITLLLLQEHKKTHTIQLRKFYMRRLLRLAPAIIIVLLCYYLYGQVFLPDSKNEQVSQSALSALLYVSNIVSTYGWLDMNHLIHTWSLSIEEQFYLLWPVALLFMLVRVNNIPRLIFIISFLIVSIWINRILLELDGAPIRRLYFGSDTHSDGLLIGCLAAVIVVNYSEIFTKIPGWLSRLIPWIPILAVVFYIFSTLMLNTKIRFVYIWFFPLLNLVSIVLIVSLYYQSTQNIKHNLFYNPGLVWLGRISYGLYLWHPLVFGILSDNGIQGVTVVLYGLPVAILLATSSYYFIELPVLKLKKKYY